MVRSAAEVESLSRGMASRATAATAMNKAFATVLTVTIERRTMLSRSSRGHERLSRVRKAAFGWLAGSERDQKGLVLESNRSRLRETQDQCFTIRTRNVIAALTRPAAIQLVTYRIAIVS